EARDGRPSVRAVHVVPAFADFQTPPCAPQAYTMLGSVGWIAMLLTRPLTSPRGEPLVCPPVTFDGPMASHCPCVRELGEASVVGSPPEGVLAAICSYALAIAPPGTMPVG